MNDKTFKAIEYAETPLPVKPRLVPWVTCLDLGDDRLQFRAADYKFTLRSKLFIDVFEAIRPLLDGHHSQEQVCASCGEDILPTTVIFLLKILRANGLLQEGEVIPPLPLTPSEVTENHRILRFLSQFVLDSSSVLASLRKARVGVMGSSALKALVLNALKNTGIDQAFDLKSLSANNGNHREVDSNLDFLIACEESAGFSLFETVNKACIEKGIRWMCVSIEGTTAQLGPTIIPNQTACYSCYVRRIHSNLPDWNDYAAYQKQLASSSQGLDQGFLIPLGSLLAGHAAIECARILSGFDVPTTLGRFYRMEKMSPVSVGHSVLRLPRCPVCNSRSPLRQAWDSARFGQA